MPVILVCFYFSLDKHNGGGGGGGGWRSAHHTFGPRSLFLTITRMPPRDSIIYTEVLGYLRKKDISKREGKKG